MLNQASWDEGIIKAFRKPLDIPFLYQQFCIFKAVEPATSTMRNLITKTVLKSSEVSSNGNFKLGGKLVCKRRQSE